MPAFDGKPDTIVRWETVELKGIWVCIAQVLHKFPLLINHFSQTFSGEPEIEMNSNQLLYLNQF